MRRTSELINCSYPCRSITNGFKMWHCERFFGIRRLPQQVFHWTCWMPNNNGLYCGTLELWKVHSNIVPLNAYSLPLGELA
eukprot:scaffold2636_cov340-Pavlova_lutheri.AAC.99